METKTLVAAVKHPRIDEDNTKDPKHAKKMQISTDMLLHLYHEGKHIFLYFTVERSDVLSSLYKGSSSNYKEVRLRSEIIGEKMEEFDKIKNMYKPELDAFVINGIFDDNVCDVICKEPSSHPDSYITAVCFKQQVDDGKKKDFHPAVMEWMKQNNKGYLEFSDRGIGSDTSQGVTDTDEDNAPALDSVDLESFPFFPDPSLSRKDPKKSPKLFYILNKIRRAQKCPEELLTEPYPATTSQSEGYNDLEVDAPPSGRQTSPSFFESEPSESSKSKKLERNDTNMTNLRYLLETQAAKDLLLMGYDSDTVLEAISSYIKYAGHVEFNVEALIGIIAGEYPKKSTAAVQNKEDIKDSY